YQEFNYCHAVVVVNSLGYFEANNVKLLNFRSNGFSVIGTNNVRISNNEIIDCYQEAILTSINGKNCVIENNFIENSYWGIDSNMNNTIIKNNIIKNVEI